MALAVARKRLSAPVCTRGAVLHLVSCMNLMYEGWRGGGKNGENNSDLSVYRYWEGNGPLGAY